MNTLLVQLKEAIVTLQEHIKVKPSIPVNMAILNCDIIFQIDDIVNDDVKLKNDIANVKNYMLNKVHGLIRTMRGLHTDTIKEGIEIGNVIVPFRFKMYDPIYVLEQLNELICNTVGDEYKDRVVLNILELRYDQYNKGGIEISSVNVVHVLMGVYDVGDEDKIVDVVNGDEELYV